MISKQEIMEHAKKFNLSANTIEKDYVLNWLLAGISASEALKNQWIFKGGTCLKKCFFEVYRFSEDLDFTITDAAHLNSVFLKNEFTYISEWVYEYSGIEIPNDGIMFELYENPRGKTSAQGKIAYKGPMQRRGNHPTVKLDLCWDEIVVEETTWKLIHHPYTDLDFTDFHVQTYSLEEIFAEKLRALVERMRPRDLYDVINLHVDGRWQLDRARVLSTLTKKCAFKSVEVPTMDLLNSSPSKNEILVDWNDMLAHQIADLESCEYYWEKLPSVFFWLYDNV
jgi:predicted nucleotidyltransferase component of viral defense system